MAALVEGVAYCLQDGRFAAAPDSDQRVELGREMQHLPVEDAAVEADAADVRRLVLGRLNGNPPSGIAQGKLDRLERQFAQLQVAGFASPTLTSSARLSPLSARRAIAQRAWIASKKAAGSSGDARMV